jgi:hypothetical protein
MELIKAVSDWAFIFIKFHFQYIFNWTVFIVILILVIFYLLSKNKDLKVIVNFLLEWL